MPDSSQSRPLCFADLLEQRAGTADALLAPGRPSLSYAGLAELAVACRGWLNARGIGRGDRVAIVLPNGPEMAAAFLAIGASATTCPLNPSYRAEEFAFYLDDLKAKALFCPPARTVRRRRWRESAALPSWRSRAPTIGRPVTSDSAARGRAVRRAVGSRRPTTWP